MIPLPLWNVPLFFLLVYFIWYLYRYSNSFLIVVCMIHVFHPLFSTYSYLYDFSIHHNLIIFSSLTISAIGLDYLIHLHLTLLIYSLSFNNTRLGVLTSCAAKTPCIMVDFHKTNSLLLTDNLTDNINCQLIHVLYIYYTMYSNNNVTWRK